jgi:hypothetical protein
MNHQRNLRLVRILVVLLALGLAGCTSATPDSDSGEPSQPIYDGLSAEEAQKAKAAQIASGEYFTPRNQTRADPWPANITSQVLAKGAVQWHDDPTSPMGAFDRATQPVVHPCTFQGSPYFNNAALTGLNVWNFTDGLEVILEWDLTSFTDDELRLSYRPGANGEYTDSETAGSGESIHLDVDFLGWSEKATGRWGNDWSFYACPPSDTGDVDPPPVFEGELRYKIIAHKMSDIPPEMQFDQPN